MTNIDYNERIPNNVDLADDRRLTSHHGTATRENSEEEE